MKRSISALLAGATLALPISGALAAPHLLTQQATHVAAPTPVVAITSSAKKSTSTKAKPKTSIKHKKTTPAPKAVTIQGPGVDMQWGTVQVTLVIKGKKIVDVQTVAPNERARSAYINSIAVPYLRQETLKAQSANIDLITGATMTSEAFAQSLQSALTTAHL